tara:strand:- start:281 stop:1480 length:1200 start_codon:yes stop_codon:yes gene_type:complete
LNDKLNIPIAKTFLTQTEIESVLEPLRSGWLVQGTKVREFEEKWSYFTGAKNSIAVTSCTSALYLSLVALGFKKGDEAIVPAFSWISTANVVEHLGGKVIFVDIEIDTFNIDVSKIEDLITPKTKAIIPVHLFGLSAQINQIIEIASKHNLLVIEDAACGFGAFYQNQHVGTFGNTGCFSFHPRKAITTGEGGMITTNDHKLADKLRKLRDHGAAKTDLQRHLGSKPYLLSDHPYPGYNLRMTDIQGALGSSQMNRVHQIINQRRVLAKKYDEKLHAIDIISTPINTNSFQHGYQSYACFFMKNEVKIALENNNESELLKIHKERNKLMEYLQDKGISTRPATHAIHMLEFYKTAYDIKPFDFRNSYASFFCSISLPFYIGMHDEELEYIVEALNNKYI